MAGEPRIALFIDGANLYATSKQLGFDMDYRRLLKEFQGRGNLIRAFYFTTLVESEEYTSIRPLVDWLDYNGFTVVTKPLPPAAPGRSRLHRAAAQSNQRPQTKTVHTRPGGDGPVSRRTADPRRGHKIS